MHGLNCIHAIPGMGKTWFALNDTLLLSRHPDLDLDVRYAAWDMNSNSVKLMYQNLGAKPDEIRLICRDTPIKGDYLVNLHLELIMDWAEDVGKKGVIFMDRLDQYAPGDRNSSKGCNDSLSWFLRLTALGTTVIVLSHQVQSSERLEGHQALEGSMEGICTLSAVDDDPQTIAWESYRRGINGQGTWAHPKLDTAAALRRFKPRRRNQGGRSEGPKGSPTADAIEEYLEANAYLLNSTFTLALKQAAIDGFDFSRSTFHETWTRMAEDRKASGPVNLSEIPGQQTLE